MDNLNSKVRFRGSDETDRFNERSVAFNIDSQANSIFVDDGIKRVMNFNHT